MCSFVKDEDQVSVMYKIREIMFIMLVKSMHLLKRPPSMKSSCVMKTDSCQISSSIWNDISTLQIPHKIEVEFVLNSVKWAIK